MDKKIEVGLGSIEGAKTDSFELGKAAAQQALSGITIHSPSLVMVFASIKYDLSEMLKGIRMVTKETPLIGTTTGGEIADKFQEGTIVVLVLASPYLKAVIGVGERVSGNTQQSMDEAFAQCRLEEFLTSQAVWENSNGVYHNKQNHILAIMFSPGSTKTTPSPSQMIMRILQKKTRNRLPLFGGSSGDDLAFEQNYQFANDRVLTDSVVLCIIETELRFGQAVDHGFTPTNRKAVITKVQNGHKVIEFDQRPAAFVYADMMHKTVDELKKQEEHLTHYTRTPLGQCTDYGEYVLKVPDFILEDNSIVFTPLVFENTVLTLMEGTIEKTLPAARNAVNSAIIRGGIKNPSLVLFFPCVLRRILFEGQASREVEIVKQEVGHIPVAGFYTYGEQNMSDDNILTYYNETASVLVFGNELNDVARVNRENKRLYKQLQTTIEDLERANEENKRKAEDLAIARDRALKADKTKSEFLANMSHELRTPLNSIIGFTGMILMGIVGDISAEQKKQLLMVKHSAHHLLNLINDILDISKIESGKTAISPEEFYIDDVIQEVIDIATPMVNEKGIELLRETPKKILIISDRQRVKQILMNLVSNAVKFTDQGSVTIKSGISKHGHLELSVIDTGTGIKMEDIGKLFGIFQQVDMTSTKEHEGTGLGLYLSKNLAAMLGGDITVKSEYGKGSRFIVNLPLKYKETK